MKKQELQQEIAELQKQLEEKQKALAAMPDKWEPKGGKWFVTLGGSVSSIGEPHSGVSSFGMEYATLQQAEKAAKAMRAHNRLLAYVAEFAPDYDLNWLDLEQSKYYVSFSCKHMCWDPMVARETISAGVVYMPMDVAEELCRKLNSGEIEL